ncbi:C-type lectin domain family 4 member E [Megalops cyprinoides]|uniref:C-type lectin domain family 4 member E n=1 Tax=Megalops cyprinoides TaxID=118141 RepID=UPI001863EC73|nr:C-type lectin domain family 4 member E [Megalops cyprinoides]
MEDAENYTSLQEFTEDISCRGNKPILYTAGGKQGAQGGKWGARRQTVLLLITTLLVSVSANIALGVLLYNRPSISPCSQVVENTAPPPSLSRKYDNLQNRYSQLCQEYTDIGKKCSQSGVSVKRCKPCPDSWLHLEDKCYYFSPDKMDWKESKENCESMGSYLTILESHKQHEALEKEARKIGGFDYHFWIGLSDIETEGEWKWVDNTPVNNTYWDDVHSEPDNHLSGGLHGEDCAVLNSHSRSWFDVPCEFIYKRICEMAAVKVD